MNRKQPLLLALSAAMVIGTSAPAFAAEATDAATREDVISLLWQQEGAPVINYALPFTDVADTAAERDQDIVHHRGEQQSGSQNRQRLR